MALPFSELLWLFLIYSFAGWLAETALAAARRGRMLNRGFLNAPFSPIYGMGGVLFAIFLPELRDSPFFLFLFGMVLATFLELVTGVCLERLLHQKWWDYSGARFQFEGHICLKYSLIWGLSALPCVLVVDPLLRVAIGLIPGGISRILLTLLYILLAIDFVASWTALVHLKGTVQDPDSVPARLARLTQRLDNVVTRAVQRRMARAYPSLERQQLRQRPTAAKVERTRFAQGCGFYKLVLLFFIGSFLGDIIETIFCYFTAGVMMSRSSVVYGPFSIVWGLGCVLLTAILYKYRDRSDRYIFLFGTVVGGVYEYVCSVFTELMFGTVFWDYSHIPFNLGGRVNLLFCFFWGIVAVVWLKGVYPRLSSLIESVPRSVGTWGTWALIVFMLVNVIISSLAMVRYSQRSLGVPAQSAVDVVLDQRFPDARMERIYPNAIIVTD